MAVLRNDEAARDRAETGRARKLLHLETNDAGGIEAEFSWARKLELCILFFICPLTSNRLGDKFQMFNVDEANIFPEKAYQPDMKMVSKFLYGHVLPQAFGLPGKQLAWYL